MKKFIKILIIVCAFVNSLNLEVVCFSLYNNSVNSLMEICHAETEDSHSTYAKALSDCKLFKSKDMVDDLQSVIFDVPETYFVLIHEKINDNCYKAQYGKYIGYVNVSKVTLCSFIPIVKTLDNVTFDIKSSAGTQIWSNPSASSNICTTISAGTKDITYIASVSGDVPYGGESKTWYYVYYTPTANSTNVYEGYIYSENTTNLSEIVANTEVNPVDILSEQPKQNLVFISSTIKTIVISIIVIPIILFFAIILYKIIKKLRKNTNKDKNYLSNGSAPDCENMQKANAKSIEKYKDMTLVKNKHFSPNFPEFNDEELL